MPRLRARAWSRLAWRGRGEGVSLVPRACSSFSLAHRSPTSPPLAPPPLGAATPPHLQLSVGGVSDTAHVLQKMVVLRGGGKVVREFI